MSAPVTASMARPYLRTIQPMPPASVSPPTPTLAGITGGQREPGSLQRGGNGSPGRARAHADLPGDGVEDPHFAQVPQVDDHAAVARAVPGRAVAAGPHRHGQAGAGRIAQRDGDPGGVAWSHYEVWRAGREDGSRSLVVTVLPGREDLPGHQHVRT